MELRPNRSGGTVHFVLVTGLHGEPDWLQGELSDPHRGMPDVSVATEQHCPTPGLVVINLPYAMLHLAWSIPNGRM